jgi:transposase InsO family protein
MLNDNDFNSWCNKLNIDEKTTKFINNIRNSQPVRVVGGGRRNVIGRYPSRKMGFTIQFESHKVELASIYEMEHDRDVLEYYDQPCKIKLNYISKNGRNVGFNSTPDFFVIRNGSVMLEEWKDEEELIKLSNDSPYRYCKDSNGLWRCPPAEKYLQEFGVGFIVRTNSNINWILQRNLIYLEDYLVDDEYQVNDAIKEVIIDRIHNQPGIFLSELKNVQGDYTVDDVHYLLARREIFIDLNKDDINESDSVHVYESEEHAKAYSNIKFSKSETDYLRGIIEIKVGKKLLWNGNAWTILNDGIDQITLMSENQELCEIPYTSLQQLINQGSIKPEETGKSLGLCEAAKLILASADKNDIETANFRYNILFSGQLIEESEDKKVAERTKRHWNKKYKEAQLLYNYGYIGLIPQHKSKGNYNEKLPRETLDLMEKYIENEYELKKNKNRTVVYGQFATECELNGFMIASYKTFCDCIRKRDTYKSTKKRKGERAAYIFEPFYWEITMTTPRHGSRPYEIGHIDHTELDIELICPKTGKNLGRPYVTFLSDAYSRKILAFYLTFDPPSYKSAMMVLRECVKRHNRLPGIIVVDNGKEFHSVYFEKLLAMYEICKKHRPSAKARFGSVLERIFGTTNTEFIHNLQGNTQLMKNVRQITKSINPKNNAIWDFDNFNQMLTIWCYDIYDTKEHSGIGQTPREAFEIGILHGGKRPSRYIPFDDDFILMTLPTTRSGKAKVQVGKGVKINNIYYWDKSMKTPEIENKTVEVKFDPFNVGIAYVYINKRWVRCISEYYARLNGKTLREVQKITEEIKKKNANFNKKFIVNARHVADFITLAEEEEVYLNERYVSQEEQKIAATKEEFEGSEIEDNNMLVDMVNNHDENAKIPPVESHIAIGILEEY